MTDKAVPPLESPSFINHCHGDLSFIRTGGLLPLYSDRPTLLTLSSSRKNHLSIDKNFPQFICHLIWFKVDKLYLFSTTICHFTTPHQSHPFTTIELGQLVKKISGNQWQALEAKVNGGCSEEAVKSALRNSSTPSSGQVDMSLESVKRWRRTFCIFPQLMYSILGQDSVFRFLFFSKLFFSKLFFSKLFFV